MKHFLKVLLILVLCVTLFAACDDKKDDGDTTTTTTTTTDPGNGGEENPPANNEPLTLVNADGTTNYCVITQTGLAGEAKTNVLDFISKVQSKTGVRLPQRQETSAPENDYEITINVQRNRADAAEVLGNTPYTHYRVAVSGNRIIVTAFTEKGLDNALNDLYKQIKRASAGEPWTIPADYSANELSVKKTYREEALMSDEYRVIYNDFIASVGSIPKFQTQVGSITPLHTLGNDGFAIAVKNTNQTEYEAYVQAMLTAGFEQYATNTVSAGSNTNEVNIYHTFTAEKIHVFTHWQPNLDVVRIYFMPPAALPELTPPTLEATDTVPVTVAQMQIAYNGGGMSYVYQLADGKFILVDGGTWHAETQQYLIDYLNEKAAAAGMAKPEIAMWIFSHPHMDHIGLASGGFLEYCHSNGIHIESFAYNFGDQLNTTDSHSNQVFALEMILEELFPNATIYTPHAGQIYYFKGMTIEILATEEEFYPFESTEPAVTQNHLCMTWRVILDNGKTVMFLADNTQQINAQLAKVYREYLKSDILQVAHHGETGGDTNCYKYIDPDICLWACSYNILVGRHPGTLFGGKYSEAQWRQGFRFVLVNGVPVDENGNPTNDPDAAQKAVIYEANVWLQDESIKDRQDFHTSETVTIGTDLSFTIKREVDSGITFNIPTFGEGETPDYTAGVMTYTGS